MNGGATAGRGDTGVSGSRPLGVAGFAIGAVFTQLVGSILVGIPALLAILIAQRTGTNLTILLAGAVACGAVAAGGVGHALGRRPELDWWFIAGPALLILGYVSPLMRVGAGVWNARLLGILGCAIAGPAALMAGFSAARLHRGPQAPPA